MVRTVLRSVEECKERGMKGADVTKWVETASTKHGLSRQHRDSNKDVISHFVLRLAYCRTCVSPPPPIVSFF